MTYVLMLVMHLGSSGREKENLICPGSPVNGLNLRQTWRVPIARSCAKNLRSFLWFF